MKVRERQYLRILQILQKTDKLTKFDTIRGEYNNAIGINVLQKILDKMIYDGLIDQDENDKMSYKINAAGLEMREQLQLQKEYEDEVKKIPKSTIDTNNTVRTNIPIQRNLVIASIVISLLALLISGVNVYVSYRNLTKEPPTQITQIEKSLERQMQLIDSLQRKIGNKDSYRIHHVQIDSSKTISVSVTEGKER